MSWILLSNALNKSYQQNQSRPYTTLAYAQSLDGSISGKTGYPLRLSCPESMLMTHHLREWHDGILVGINTVIADNPSLTVRLCPGNSPTPIIIDPSLRTPLHCQLLTLKSNPIILTMKSNSTTSTNDPKAASTFTERKLQLEKLGARILMCQCDTTNNKWIDLHDAMKQLHVQYNLNKIMIEGGAGVITSFLQTQYRNRKMISNASEMGVGKEKNNENKTHSIPPLINMINLTIAPIFVGGVRSINSLLPASADGLYPNMKESKLVLHVGKDIVIQGELQSTLQYPVKEGINTETKEMEEDTHTEGAEGRDVDISDIEIELGKINQSSEECVEGETVPSVSTIFSTNDDDDFILRLARADALKN